MSEMSAEEDRDAELGRNIRLREFIIVVGGGDHDPGWVNPDFFAHNGIVEPTVRLLRPVMIQAGFASLRYSNDVLIIADENTTGFYQEGFALAEDEIVSPGMVERYLESVGTFQSYQYINVVIRGILRFRLPYSPPLRRQGLDNSVGANFRDSVPRVSVRSSYDLGDRVVDLHVSDMRRREDRQVFGMSFRVHIRREVPGEADPGDFFSSVLGLWRDDVADFRELSAHFFLHHSQLEG